MCRGIWEAATKRKAQTKQIFATSRMRRDFKAPLEIFIYIRLFYTRLRWTCAGAKFRCFSREGIHFGFTFLPWQLTWTVHFLSETQHFFNRHTKTRTRPSDWITVAPQQQLSQPSVMPSQKTTVPSRIPSMGTTPFFTSRSQTHRGKKREKKQVEHTRAELDHGYLRQVMTTLWALHCLTTFLLDRWLYIHF